MGFLSIFKAQTKSPAPLPSGSFTIDSTGEIVTSTIPSSFSKESLKQIGHMVLQAFKDARKTGQNIGELAIQYSALDLKARELRGGAIIFLSPHAKNVR